MKFRGCCFALIALVLIPHARGQTPARASGERDLDHTMRARKMLADDTDLAEWNIGVLVIDRVARLWGPVVSAEVAFRAELRLRTMIELTAVRNELIVTDALAPTPAPLKIDIPPRVLPNFLPPQLPAEPRPIFGAPAQLTGQDKSGAKPAQPASSDKAKTGPVEIQPPQKLDSQPLCPRKLPAGEPQGRALESAIRALLHSKRSYDMVTFALRGGRVYLKSTDADPDPLQEAARAISRLPNVDGVVVVDKTTR